MTTRHTTTGLLAAAALALATTACGPASSAGPQRATQAAPAVLTPKQRLQAALDKLTAASYDLTIRAGADRASGTVDPADGAAAIRLTTPIDADVTLEMDETVLAGKVLMRLDAGQANAVLHFHPTRWLRIDLTKLEPGVALPLDPKETEDPLQVYGLLQGVTEVTAKDATHLTGTMDLTAIGGVSGPDQSDIDKAGPKAKATPFTATLDATGRLAGLTINGPAADNLAMTFTFSHFGAAKAVSSPAPVSDAPADVYAMLNG